MIAVMYKIVDALAEDVVPGVLDELVDVLRHKLYLALLVDDKEEAVESFQQQWTEHFVPQHCGVG